ncbi:MAG: substrate-binding domain-containing protein, partial [Oscillospiraceae bacterium]|nr:substrate-binding domain-containing protein [Oscillospiraceae bacterium]
MKKFLALLLAFVMTMSMVACGKTNTNAPSDSGSSVGISAPKEDVAMQYISVDDAFAVLEDDAYIFFDVRKAADHQTSHIPGAEGYDMDAAKSGDFDAGVTTMNAAIKDLDKNIIIICYSGKSYAQATTNVLSALGYDMSKVYTLEGGYTAWTEKHADTVEVGKEITAPTADVAMQYMTPADAAEKLGNEEYVFLDVRKAADFNVATIPGAKGYDMDAAKGGDFAAGVATMQVATRDRSKNLVIICYSGKTYAQATTNVLSALGYDMSKVYTLEGGFTAWSKAYPDQLQVGIVAPEKDVEMQYITVAETEKVLNNEEYVIFDVRKTADFNVATIPGAKGYDMDAAKEGNFDAGVATMQIATRNLDKKIILVCYSGKRYAQATTNVLSALGYDMSKVYTLEGGFNAWSEAHPTTIDTQIHFCGSSSLAPVIASIGAAFTEEFGTWDKVNAQFPAEEIDIAVTSGGSGDGPSSVVDGTADFGMLARSVKDSEKEALGAGYTEFMVAYDALTISINKNNPLSTKMDNIDTDTIRKIFSGEIAYWDEVDPSLEHKEIVIVIRDLSGGAAEVFEKNVMQGTPISENAIQ